MSLVDPLTRRRLERFRGSRAAWWSFLLLGALILLAALGPLLVGHRPLVVRTERGLRFPALSGFIPAEAFGMPGRQEPNYRLLDARLRAEGRGWALMPLVPFAPGQVCEVQPPAFAKDDRWHDPRGPIVEGRVFVLADDGSRSRSWYVVDGRLHGEARRLDHGVTVARAKFNEGKFVSATSGGPDDWKPSGDVRTLVPSPCPPGLDGHWLGTDESGHDVVARLFGGFRLLLAAALVFLPAVYLVGLLLGGAMGYFGGRFDMALQRVMEIWSNVPFLYAIIFLASLLEPSLALLSLLLVAFSWIGLAQQLRASAYQAAARDYVTASRALGAGHFRIIWRHVLPNCSTVILTTVPFSLHGLIFSLSSLDYLGFGLPPTEPTWGELLRQANENPAAWWILVPTVACLVGLMVLINAVGEGLQDAFDLKRNR
ncbi:MAG: ABC transporter permease subunit [Opitutales bacterium]